MPKFRQGMDIKEIVSMNFEIVLHSHETIMRLVMVMIMRLAMILILTLISVKVIGIDGSDNSSKCSV